MEVIFLGTGTSQGVPIIGSTHPVCLSTDPKDKRLRSSILIKWDKASVVIDCGPDFRQQMLTHHIDRLDAVLFTHEHTDHIIGLDDIRPFFYRQQKDIPLYAEPWVFKALYKRFEYIFDPNNNYPGKPQFQCHDLVENQSIDLWGKEVLPVRINHGTLPILGFRMGDFAYFTDVKSVPENTYEKLSGVKTLVVNALRRELHPSHFSLDEALDFISKVAPQKSYLTHISHLLGFHKEVENQLPENVFLAYDGLRINV